ncbi:diguanylate cyclase [Fervidobacterium riparium]|uniref:Diguanylate cyclase (GGDEF) domain-containing protein n=1 Tax=Fervidobacterium gondwanense DSM 13020 TaxID=1121883 RepID=A0A1M7T0A1_FERGO|nr:sensor domain-containing diguanylate cyclase [Fervidobacterium gondwanense]UXF01104.1 diguanylate cyclase [Fervidobacterium riparium]SHN64114.1 diguanylate cyclase (GGDEF) domain-containing protein [Fervidobacterium gondwanense DSM 13020]
MRGYFSYYMKSSSYSLAFFLSLLLLFRWSIAADGILIEQWQVLRDSNQVFQSEIVDGRFYRVIKKPSTVRLRAILDSKKLKNNTNQPLYIYIPQIDTSYFAVYLDGQIIGSFGFENERTAHVWYQPFIFKLPEKIAVDSNIEFLISGVYEIGIDFPVTIINETQKSKYAVLYFLTSLALPIATGLALTLSVILYSIAMNLSNNKKEIYRHLAIASFFATVWLFDLFAFPTMGSVTTFLILRKIFVASGYLGFAALLYAIDKEVSSSLSKTGKVMVATNFIGAASLLFSPSNYLLKEISNNVALLLLANAVYLFFKSLKMYSRVLMGFIMFFIYAVLHDGISMFFSTGTKLLSGFGIASMFAGFAYTLVQEYKQMVVQITMSHIKSITDPLTNAYNRGALSGIVFSPDDAFVYIDMDRFKEINDKHGHDTGDEILKLLVSTIKRNIRSNDMVVRMGGDEFLVVLRSCPVNKAQEIFEKISKEFYLSHILHPKFSYGIVQYQFNLEKTIRVVDDLMYKMKESRR